MHIKYLAAPVAALALLAACAPASKPTPPSAPSAPSAPAPAQYDATGTMPCSLGQPSYDQQCNWGVVRTDPGRAAAITISALDGTQTVLNFADGDFTSPKGNLQYLPDPSGNGFWLVNVNDREFYRFAFEVITGG